MMESPMVRIEREDLSLFSTVDDIISRSITAGDPMIALEYIQKLQRDGLIRGLAIAKLMFRLKQSWDLFRVAGVGDEFENVIETTLGYKPATATKYVRMWESVFENPDLSEDLKKELAGRPIQDLLLLTAAAREGSLDTEDWERIAKSSDSVRDIVREKRGDVTSSKSAVKGVIVMRTGSMARGTIYIPGDERKVAGYLNLDTGDPDIDKLNERIINAAHLFETY
jgi:hypothetical protein